MDIDSRAVFYHKLRSPLAVIKSALSLVVEGNTGPINDRTKKFVGHAYQKTEELIHSIDEMEKQEKVILK